MNNVFEINKDRYTLNVSIYQKDQNQPDLLLVENIHLIEYTNEMGVLVNHGTLEYLDKDCRIDKYLQQQYVYCQVSFSRLNQKAEGNVVVELTPDKLDAVFFVDNIAILDSGRDGITYKLFLVSDNNFDVRQYFEYSNYKDGDESVVELIRKVLSQSGMSIDKQSFDNVQTVAQTSYITTGQDTVGSCIRFLLNKLFYFESYGLDDSIKTLIYDEFEEVYHMFDIKKLSDFQKYFPVTLTMVKNETDIVRDSPVDIAFVVKKSNTDQICDTIPTITYDYDYNTNEFNSTTFNPKKILGYYKSGCDMTKNVAIANESLFKKKQMAWSNDIDFYGKMFDNLTRNQSLIANVSGQLGLIPGWLATVNVAVDGSMSQSDTTRGQDIIARYYRGLCGTWTVSKVTTFIDTSKRKFRQNINLVRTSN